MIINRQNKYQGHIKVDELTIKTKKGKEIRREVVNRGNAVAALVYDTSMKKYIFVSQWRPGTLNDIIEIPAGMLDHENEDKREAITREIEEEIGYKVDNLKLIDELYVSPGATSELVTIYYAEVSEKIGDGGGLDSEDEEIEIIELTEQEMLSTRFNDAKTIIAVQWSIHHKHIKL